MAEAPETKERILRIAREEFYKKGFEGARLQEIADKAEVNKALLYYYFKNKDTLFREVFDRAFRAFVVEISALFKREMPLGDKVSLFVDNVIDSLLWEPSIAVFILHELNRNPQRVSEIFGGNRGVDFQTFKKQVAEEQERGRLKHTTAEQFFADMVGLCVYPFLGKPILHRVLDKDEIQYRRFLEERKEHVKKVLWMEVLH